MRWINTQAGEIRERRRFFWFPFEFGEHTYWLESRTVTEKYMRGAYGRFWVTLDLK